MSLIEKIYGMKKKALRKQCYTFLAGQSTAREKPSQRIPTYEQIICIEI